MKTFDPALVQAGKMSHALDEIRQALVHEDSKLFGEACERLLAAKYRYDREIERKCLEATE